jgi:hypothetical protein
VAWIAKATEASNVLSSQLHLNLLNRRRLAKGDVHFARQVPARRIDYQRTRADAAK